MCKVRSLIEKFNRLVKKRVREIYEYKDTYLFVASDGPDDIDPFYITKKDVKDYIAFSPVMDLALYNNYMRNKIYG